MAATSRSSAAGTRAGNFGSARWPASPPAACRLSSKNTKEPTSNCPGNQDRPGSTCADPTHRLGLPAATASMLVGSVIAGTLFGVIGVALGYITRSIVAAVVGAVGWVLFVEQIILPTVAPQQVKWLISGTAADLTTPWCTVPAPSPQPRPSRSSAPMPWCCWPPPPGWSCAGTWPDPTSPAQRRRSERTAAAEVSVGGMQNVLFCVPELADTGFLESVPNGGYFALASASAGCRAAIAWKCGDFLIADSCGCAAPGEYRRPAARRPGTARMKSSPAPGA